MRRILWLVLVLVMFFPCAGLAQVGPGGTMNSVVIQPRSNTFSTAVVITLSSTIAANPTDLITLYGATGSTIRIKKVVVSGITAAAGTMDVSIVKRTAADSGGTKGTTPVAAQWDSAYTANNPSVATLALYTANPTLGAGVAVATQMLNFPVAGAASYTTFDFTSAMEHELLLKKTTEGMAINLNGGALPTTGRVTAWIEWVESTP